MKPNFASIPARSIILAKPAVVNERELDLCLCDRMAILECTEQRGPTAAAPASATLRPNWQTPMEER